MTGVIAHHFTRMLFFSPSCRDAQRRFADRICWNGGSTRISRRSHLMLPRRRSSMRKQTLKVALLVPSTHRSRDGMSVLRPRGPEDRGSCFAFRPVFVQAVDWLVSKTLQFSSCARCIVTLHRMEDWTGERSVRWPSALGLLQQAT